MVIGSVHLNSLAYINSKMHLFYSLSINTSFLSHSLFSLHGAFSILLLRGTQTIVSVQDAGKGVWGVPAIALGV